MNTRRRARRNLATFWLILIGVPSSIGLAAAMWAAIAMPTYMS